MNVMDILPILNEERAWLAGQPGMQPWDEGCRHVAAMLTDCLERYSAMVRQRRAAGTDDADDTDDTLYLVRLWQCLGYHWRDAVRASATDGRIAAVQVAEQIAAGRGYRGGGRLGGDPLRDVVLAVAMVLNDERAPQVFQDDYRRLAVAVAAQVNRRLADDPDPWWNELLDYLGGYTRPEAKLDKFHGRCALQNWLPRVIARFVCRWRFDGSEEPGPENPPAPPEPPSESLTIFAGIVCQAVAELSADDRLLLTLIFVDGLPNNEAAGILGIHPGTATRRREKAVSQLQASIMQRGKERLSENGFAAVLEDLHNNPRLFSNILRESLDHVRQPFQADPEVRQPFQADPATCQAGKPDVQGGKAS